MAGASHTVVTPGIGDNCHDLEARRCIVRAWGGGRRRRVGAVGDRLWRRAASHRRGSGWGRGRRIRWERIPFVTVVFNDAALSLIRVAQERRGYADYGVRHGAVDFRAASAALGAWSRRVSTLDELQEAVQEARGLDLPAVIRDGSIVATQFHPEKSGEVGARLLANFFHALASR